MLAGFGKVDVTPPLCIPYLSFVPRQTPFSGVHDPLHARALVLSDGDSHLAVVAVDSLGFSDDVLGPGRRFTAEVRARVARRTDIPPERVMVAANHAHSTPQTTNLARLLDFPESGPWLETLLEQLASAVCLAWANRQPAEIRAGQGSVPDLARNRRSHLAADAPVDDSLAGLLVRVDDGFGCLINVACHPVAVQVNPLVSADYPGVACTLLEQGLGAGACVFLQGACGDLNPVRNTSDFEDVRRYGWMVAGQAMHLMARLDAPDWPALEPPLAAGSCLVTLPPYPVPDAAPLAAEVTRLEATAAQYPPSRLPNELASALRLARDRLAMAQRGPVPVTVEVQALRIGHVGIVGVPGELFCRLGMEIKRRSPAPLTLVSAYTNGYEGYFPTSAAFAEGGYETSLGPWCRVGPGAGEQLVEAAVEVLERLWS